MDILEYLEEKSDEEILQDIEVAKVDLLRAAENGPNSSCHEACFAGLIVLNNEAVRRGIKSATVH